MKSSVSTIMTFIVISVSVAGAQVERVFSREDAMGMATSPDELLGSYFNRDQFRKTLQINGPIRLYVDGAMVGCWYCNDRIVSAELKAPWEIWFRPFVCFTTADTILSCESVGIEPHDTAYVRYANAMPVLIQESGRSSAIEYKDGRINVTKETIGDLVCTLKYHWIQDSVRMYSDCMESDKKETEYGSYCMNPTGWTAVFSSVQIESCQFHVSMKGIQHTTIVKLA